MFLAAPSVPLLSSRRSRRVQRAYRSRGSCKRLRKSRETRVPGQSIRFIRAAESRIEAARSAPSGNATAMLARFEVHFLGEGNLERKFFLRKIMISRLRDAD